ncbi:Fis family transcriptional regulator [Thiorhodococcus mannitoliphagus]|uniref:Fis family transcriptional regulator n=1 Tax=Thiorhodococcus mannitoliphagus TaxID=329406 RepID=A0A6P1DST3_9GAMM|nr:HPF/RaiA family ribosome-associated protein [Thiorhodococcus mannitoliphagus]NEX21158.1 Fis family transcriptional regulator [Thiorhodococcus mannitoliphagus]
MVLKIGGDTLALDAEIRRQIESEAQKLADRFPGERIEAQVNVQEEFDQLHGHRVRCELSAKLASSRQVVVREARKTAKEAIAEVFLAARRNVRRLRRQSVMGVAPKAPAPPRAAHVVTR